MSMNLNLTTNTLPQETNQTLEYGCEVFSFAAALRSTSSDLNADSGTLFTHDVGG